MDITGGIKFLIPVLGIFFILLAAYLLYLYLNRNTWKIGLNVFKTDLVSSSIPKAVPNCEIVPPLDFANYSVDFKIFIDNFHENHTYWRHVFHKGSYANTVETLNFKYSDQSEENSGWKDLVAQFPDQGLGVWLHPNKSALRICLTTNVKLANKKGYDLSEHPMSNESKDIIIDNDDISRNQIEYCDIDDVPVKILTQISITIDKNVMSVYVNKTLRKICTFEGDPIYNSMPLFFVHQRTFDGYIKDFKIIPYFLKDTQVKNL